MLSAAVLLAAFAVGAWGNGGCAPDGAVAPLAPLSKLPQEADRRYRWKTTDDQNFTLYDRGMAVATYIWDTDVFQYFGQSPSIPPWGVRAAQSKTNGNEKNENGDIPNFGIDRGMLNQKQAWISINGKPVPYQDALAAIEGIGPIPDDGNKLRLTIIGHGDECKKIIEDFTNDPAFNALKDKLVIKFYTSCKIGKLPWAIENYGFKTDGKPMIYLQAPNGEVLHRQADYEGGAQLLASAVRKADPNYKPENDPDKRKTSGSGLIDQVGDFMAKIPLWGWIGGAVVVLFLFSRKD